MTIPGRYRGSKEFLLVYAELIMTAQRRGTITYPDLAAMMRLPVTGNHMSNQVGQMLGEIVEDEVRAGRPMLSAVVVGVSSGVPGSGFYGLAQQLGKLADDAEAAKLHFWEQERNAVYATWRREPYPQPK